MGDAKIPAKWNTRYELAKAQLALLPPRDEEDAERLALRQQCEEVIALIEENAALTARAEAAEIDWEENNALAAAKVCLEAENATLRTQLQQAKDGWDSAIADLREASGICKQAEQDRDEFERKGKELCQSYGTSLIAIHDLQQERDKWKALAMSNEKGFRKALLQRDTLRAAANVGTWVCGKCGYGPAEHGLVDHPAYRCIYEPVLITQRAEMNAEEK
jgi:hypothetical protein